MPETLAPVKLFDLVPGTRFQDYRLLEQIGVGGQGVVWSALDPSRKQVVAIKFSEIPDTEQGRSEDQLVDRQAGILTSLHHPHILPIHSFGQSRLLRYLITPYIAGGALQLKQPIPLSETFRYIAEICSALDYLHSQNVIHRDLKPGNVLLDLQHHTFLADFGLARILSGSTLALHTGHGTPPYAPPEQLTYEPITPQSDLYSLGIMLYEFFTHQLPWNGEQELGMRQLVSPEEIPDPCEINPSLPRGLVNHLRQITNADPKKRPGSAREILEMVTSTFGVDPIPVREQIPPDELVDQGRKNAIILLKEKYIQWNDSQRAMPISLTHFAMIDFYMQENAPKPIPRNMQIFMLQAALTYGYREQEWWKQTGKINDRLAVALNLIGQGNPAVGRRVLHAMAVNPLVIKTGSEQAGEISSRLLELAGTTTEPALQKQALYVLRRLTSPVPAWRDIALPPGQDYRLAMLAAPDTEEGDEAARVIGHLRSTSAVLTAFNQAERSRRSGLLLEVQGIAGELPPVIPAPIRFRTTLDWILIQLSLQPINTFIAYLVILLGALLGFGAQVYLTYRLPSYMDLTRIVVSLERGVFMAIPFGFAILLTRLLVERLGKIHAGYRLGLATFFGWLAITSAFILYDLLILKNYSFSLSMILGSLLIALGYAISAFVSVFGFRFLISLAAIAATLAGSWWLYLSGAAPGSVWSPIFYFDTSWTASQVLGLILLVSLPMAFLGNLIRLIPRME